MKRLLVVGVPLALLAALMFVRPPSFASSKASTPTPASSANTTGTTGATATNGIKPGVTGSGYDGDDAGKPAYGGHDADDYDD